MTRWIVVSVSVVLLAGVSVTVLASPKAPSATRGAVAGAPTSGSRTVRLRVPGLRSKACPVVAKAALSRLSGVELVAADLDAKTIALNYDPERVSPQLVQEVLAEAGFDSTVIAP